ncbi:hypothetical protein BN946_scf184909.g70 [Trametes cinnabarina]|uniref:BTB domain-containing protein n=1 Tax=Pycnoporus cinnabarinus TaxID=5643 RepID=A0A060SB77_PYCCI|nr:hypothetical protein BN946_scf184909.g70 [Trametes cinnabarina]
MYPISDLTAFCRKTTGDVPPKLVGASTTVVGSKMYLYGGRLVSERKMVSDIYMFDLETFKWERVAQNPEDDIPQARYFHSADTWRNHLIIFGGMAIKPQSENPEDLCVLNDVRLFDLTNRRWLPAAPLPPDSSLIPNARYAHLSSVTADRLFIIGGQDLANVWLDDVYIFDLNTRMWIQRRDYPRHCGTYRSVAVTADQRVRLPQEEMRGGQAFARLGPAGSRFKVDKAAPPAANATQSDTLIHLPYSAHPTEDYPCDIFLFSNYNFTDVQRELEVFTPLSDGDFTVSDRSASMTGTSFPPGLRFPTGAILGTYFIVAGTYLSQTYQSFSIWALDLINMTWSRIDPGSALASGSWFRSCLWASANKFVVFGNRNGNLVEDYNRRLLSWDHVTCIDLEAFGIYQPPPLVLDIPMQELGLAALEEGLMADFEIICDDGRRIKCSRKLLEDRWPWFKEQRKIFLQAATRALEAMPAVSSQTPLPEVANANRQEQRPDPRITPRAFNLSEPYPITLALLQYFYSMALITPLQHAPAVLSQLLLLSSTYQLTHLQSLVKHAMHRALSYATSVGIYGVSTLCSCRSLQIRALRVVMAYSQKRPAGLRSKADKDASAGGRGSDQNGGGGGGGNGRLDLPGTAARPRGMSDASFMRGPSDMSAPAPRGHVRGSAPEPLTSLSDLQEFGVPHGQSIKRVSDGSMVLPRMNEESRGDFGQLHMPPPPPPPPPPAMPLPQPPAQTPNHAASTDGFSERGRMPPSPLRQPSSPPTVVDHKSASPPPIIRKMPTPLSRPFSVMSQSTEQDLLAIAELLSPTVDASAENDAPVPDNAPVSELEPVPEMYFDEVSATTSVRDSVSSSMSSIYSSYHLPSSASVRSSIYTDSDGASIMGDDLPDPALLYSIHGHNHGGFHLPSRSSLPVPPLDDNRSLSSATSYSSIRTPSLSRHSSVQFINSPPLSPTSSYLPTPIDGPHGGASPQPPNSKLLDVIEEARYGEDQELRRVPSEDAQTITLGTTSSDQSSTFVEPFLMRKPEPRYSPSQSQQRKMPELEKLRINTQTLDAPPSPTSRYGHHSAHPAPMPASPVLSARSSSSGASSHRGSSSGKVGFGKLFGRGDRDKESKKSASSGSSVQPSNQSVMSLDLGPSGLSKAEEKRLKKEAARARTERLAQDLADKAKKRAEAAKAAKSARVKEKTKKPWEEEGGMYEGISYF